MKKLVAIILALLLMLSISACGGNKGGSGFDSKSIKDNALQTPEEVIEKFAGMSSYADYCSVFGCDPAETTRNFLYLYLNQKCDGSFEEFRDDFMSDFTEGLAEWGSLGLGGDEGNAYEVLSEDEIESYRNKLENASSADEFISIYVEAAMKVAAVKYSAELQEEYECFSVSNISKRELTGSEYEHALDVLTDYICEEYHGTVDYRMAFVYSPGEVNRIYAMSFYADSNGEHDYWDEILYVAETASGCYLFTLGEWG